MLCKKLKECNEQKNDSIKEILIPTEIKEKEPEILQGKLFRSFRTPIVQNQDDIIIQKEESIEVKNLKEENSLLKEIINRAATSITDVVQVYSKGFLSHLCRAILYIRRDELYF
jgi:hypothetical protein